MKAELISKSSASKLRMNCICLALAQCVNLPISKYFLNSLIDLLSINRKTHVVSVYKVLFAFMLNLNCTEKVKNIGDEQGLMSRVSEWYTRTERYFRQTIRKHSKIRDT